MTYSIAIRTLGTAGEKYRQELLSIAQQTVSPERVVVYIAEGYSRPDYTMGKEEYVWVKKGMMAQRLLPYDDITSDCILMLDDDVRLAHDSAERLLQAMEEHNADCIGADTFRNHEMSAKGKLMAVVTNLVFPHWGNRWAFKIHSNGSFSYNNHPTQAFYWSQSSAGPASLWRKTTYKALRMDDELWLDSFGYAYDDDMLEFYKIYKNGYRLGILYDAGIEHLDAQSGGLRSKPRWMYLRTKAQFAVWWRCCLCGESFMGRSVATLSYGIKAFWLFLVTCGGAIVKGQLKWVAQYIEGLKDGWLYVHSEEYRQIGSYIVEKGGVR